MEQMMNYSISSPPMLNVEMHILPAKDGLYDTTLPTIFWWEEGEPKQGAKQTANTEFM